MNNNLIEKIIQTYLGVCPDLFYKNAVLDGNVAKALAKSFVKILTLSEQNTSVHNNLRISILENIRKMCVEQPLGHMAIDENLSDALTETYIKQAQFTATRTTEKDLDAFLIKRFKALNINSQQECTMNPEIVQALLNLNENGVYLEILARDVVHWDANKGNFFAVIKGLWNTNTMDKCLENMYDNLAIKMKAEIEKAILNSCHEILVSENNIDIDNLLSNSSLIQLIKRCAVSSECFQICTGALNFLFIMTNFELCLQTFITTFVSKVRMHCLQTSSSVLYPIHMSTAAVLLDFKINDIPEPLRTSYITPALKHMQELRNHSEHDFIMLLTHFPEWFDIYFDYQDNVVA